MKKRIILAATFAFIGFSLSAQNEVPDQPFVKLKNGELHKGSLLQVNRKWLKESTVDLDSSSFKLKEVTFYKGNENVLYGSIGSNFRASIYNKNNMNIYKVLSEGMSPSSSYNPGAPATGSNFKAGTSTTNVKFYFNRGLDKIKKVNATNLLNEMKDNEEANSLIILANKQKKNAIIALGIFAGSIISYPIVVFAAPGIGTQFIGAISVGGLITSLVLNNQKWKTTYKALKIYSDFDKEQNLY